MLAFDNEGKTFETIEARKYNLEYFEKGAFCILPYEMTRKESEMLGSTLQTNQEESDLEMSDEEEEKDPFDEFSQEVGDLFVQCL